jgi:N-terminal acetyltransferase B complex catalytic subunit
MGKLESDPTPASIYNTNNIPNENYLPWHGHVTALTVAPQHRRLGLARTLTQALERGCDEQNAYFVDLFVREGNTAAVGMYRGLGYVSLFLFHFLSLPFPIFL